jgi:hypothetical protein
MRAAPFVVLGLCAVAHAGNRVVVMSERGDLPAALQLALAAHEAQVSSELASPVGEQRLDRAAAAQRTAIADNADIGVWVDDHEVWAVLADGRDVRHAPLPADATPRVFAAIATSLVDELLAPPVAPAIGVDVHVELTPAPSQIAVATQPVLAVAPAPQLAIAQPVVALGGERGASIDDNRANRVLLEIGMTASPSTFGIEAEVAMPMSRHVRLGAFAGVNQLFDGIGDYEYGGELFDAGGELRYVGDGATHVDLGLAGGITHGLDVLGANDVAIDNAGLAAVRLGVAHEFDTGVGELAVEPMLLFDARGQDRIPSVMVSARWGLPL